MAVAEKHLMAALCLVCLAGCVTDELAVYDDSELDKDELKPFAGDYQVEAWPGNERPREVSVALLDEQLRFSYTASGTKREARFVLSKIPNSKKKLHLLSIPAQQSTNQANLFFIGKAEKDQTRIWTVFAATPVARDHLSFQNGRASRDDLKKFLAKHADAFVTANDPQVVLANPKK